MRLHHLYISGLFIVFFSILAPKKSFAEGKDRLTNEHQGTFSPNSKGQDRNGPEAMQTPQSSKLLPKQESIRVAPRPPKKQAKKPGKTARFFATKNKDRNGPEAEQVKNDGKQPAPRSGSHSAK